MCQLIVSPNGNVPEWDYIESSYLANGDSWGAVYLGNTLRKVCGLAEDWANLALLHEELSDLQAPFLWHFRWATLGSATRKNCHPFAVSKDIWFAHNGVLNIPCPVPDRSDTWHMAQHFKKQNLTPERLKEKEIKNWLRGLAGHGNKFGFIDTAGETTIINETAGEWIDEVWYSNPSALYYTEPSPRFDWYTGETETELVEYDTCETCSVRLTTWNKVSGVPLTCSDCWETLLAS